MNDLNYIDQRLLKSEIIKKNHLFQTIIEQGKRWQGQYVKFFYMKSLIRQVGFSVPKRIGKAVVRNRVRRCMREVYRKHKHDFGCYQIVMMAKDEAVRAGYAGLEADSILFIQKLKIIP